MKLTRGSEHLESTYRVEVQERLYRRFPRPTEIPLDQVGELVHAYRRAELSGESLLRGMLLQKAAGRLDGQIAWMRDLAAKGSSVDTTRLQSEALELIETLSEKNRAAEGTDILATLCALPLTDPLRAPLVRRWIVGLCDESDEGGKQAIAKLGSLAWIPVENPFQRVRQMVQFYAQVAAATKALPPAVESAPGKNVYRLGQEAIEEGVMARNVEAYTRAREYRHARELLEQWESLRPLAVTEGFTRTLRVRLEMAQGHMAVACRLARQLVCAYPRNFYAAELLVLATQAAKDLKQTALVEQLQKQLLRDYPESPYARNSAGSPR